MILVLPGAEVHPTWASRVGALHDSNVTPRFLQLGFAIFCFCKMVESWKLKMSSYPKGPWFWGSSCSLAPHFHPGKYLFISHCVLLLSMLWLMDHLWPANGHPILLGASDIKWPVSSSAQWWCPTLSGYRQWPCASHPAHRFQGYLGNFHELQCKGSRAYRATQELVIVEGHHLYIYGSSAIYGNFYLSSVFGLNKSHVICRTCYFW